MQVHIDRNGQRYGPYSIEDINAYLVNGTILPTDLAWQDGMTDWLPVNQISGVVMPGGSVVTPVPPSQPVPNGNKKKILIGIGAGMGLLVLMAGIWFFFIRDTGEKGQLANNGDNNSTASKPVKELTLEEKVVGEYEAKKNGRTFRVVLLKSGVYQIYDSGRKNLENKWAIVNGEIHVITNTKPEVIAVYRINTDRSITHIAFIDDGKRENWTIEEDQFTYKKIK